MSIASAFNFALSGLTASSRMAEVVSSNIANAMTEGYARRELSISSQTLGGTGGGVRIVGVNRIVNQVVAQDLMLADAASANTTAKTDFYSRLESQIGDPETAGSLSATMSDFENALLTAGSMPDSTARLAATVRSASAVANKLNSISDDLQAARLTADKSITKQVRTLNETLSQLEEMNRTITTQISIGNDAAGLMDERQSLVNQISEIVPIRVVQRDNNQISLFTSGGAILLDGTAAHLEFEGAGVMQAGYSLATGELKGISINGVAVSTADDGPLGGGTLGAAFAVRDELAPEAQSQLDAFAMDLVSRLQDPSVDTTLSSTDAGLFTDRGAAFEFAADGSALDPAAEIGLAGRLKLNAIVDPEQGGEVWHLRDGLMAGSQGAIGNGTILNALSAALTKEAAPASGDYGPALRTSSGLASDLLSYASSGRQSSELTQGYATARQETLKEMSLADGVDTDHEMQTLLVVEKAYAANAKVIQTIDAMLQELLDI
ncbi:flagellar hook-associated protein 1 FlgK [Rhodobacter viridis]|uniref:Flagellar hook-associated protein 1 n=1 Tax=Rhodobacter viridis TaxID=1054202 RepID=A0A318UFV1_9RHOB|nr:flagellar hook-associated protein FlgK [Rhodobacter viridis]PYF11937.1 flagellar hook-associated protein 1 FlgK [Rhodobacter viridis]